MQRVLSPTRHPPRKPAPIKGFQATDFHTTKIYLPEGAHNPEEKGIPVVIWLMARDLMRTRPTVRQRDPAKRITQQPDKSEKRKYKEYEKWH
jgi:hypothetical protein